MADDTDYTAAPYTGTVFNYNAPHPGVITAAGYVQHPGGFAVANTVNYVPVAWPPVAAAAEQWNWPTTHFTSAHPVLGFVTSSPSALSFRVCEEASRSRTVIFQGRPLRLYWPRLAFFDGGHGHGSHSSANLFVFRVDGDSPLTASTPLRQFPFTLWNDAARGRVASYSHVNQIGGVCFDSEAMSIIKNGRDPVDVFWSSGFGKVDGTVLSRWSAATPAEVLAPGFFPDADWTWNRLAPGGLTVGSLLAGTKFPTLADSKAWTG